MPACVRALTAGKWTPASAASMTLPLAAASSKALKEGQVKNSHWKMQLPKIP
jgi:hypothetical protein